MPLRDCEETILLALLADIEVLGESDASEVSASVANIGIADQPAAWLGRDCLTAAERKAFSRAADRLEGLGFVKRLTERSRDRVTHLRLTADGLRFALGLAGTSADRRNIAWGLTKIDWGISLVGQD